MSERFQSFDQFWPYYLSEHRDATSRRLHFVGTSGFLGACALSTLSNPLMFPAAMAGMALIGYHATTRAEPKSRSLIHVLAMIALPTAAAPFTFLPGVVFAYGFAWAGHYRFEHNRPATFQYPVMSLTSDFRMWGHMLRGRLWSGDPLEELKMNDKWKTPAGEVSEAAAAK